MAKGTIRSRILWALFSVGGLGACLVGAVTTVAMTFEVYQIVGSTSRGLARVLKRHVQDEIQDGLELLERVAARVGEVPFEGDSLDPVLARALYFHPVFESIYAYDPGGNVVIRRYRTHRDMGEGRSRNLEEKNDPPFAQAARATLADGESRVLPVRIAHGESVYAPVLVSVPGADGSSRGILSGAIFAGGQGFGEMIGTLAPGKRGFVLLLDSEDRVLARTEHAPGKEGEALSLEFMERWGELQMRHQGKVYFAAETRLEEAGIQILVAIPRSEALQALPRVLTQIALAALVALILAGCLGIVLVERVTGPLRELLAGIHKISDGALSHRVPVSGDDELSEVGRALNRLAESLARSRMIEEIWADPHLEESFPEERERKPPADGR